jgi:ferredoxin
MSREQAVTRRGLFRMFVPTGAPPAREAPPPPPPAFSLDAFYSKREGAGAVTQDRIPTFAITARAEVPTSAVGTPAAGDRTRPATTAGTSMTIPPDMVPALRPQACIALTSFCSVCVERCPVEGALVMDLGRPRVAPDACTGCGRCVQLCPAPVNGFSLVPRKPKKEGDSSVRSRA